MVNRLFLSPPHMGEKEIEFVLDAFKSNYIAPIGPQIDEFEIEFSKKCGLKYSLAVSSGTAAMHLALRALGVGSGDKVISPSLTFIGGVAPIIYLGATPIFVDSDINTWNIDLALLYDYLKKSAKYNRLPKVVISTDIYGQCTDLESLSSICSKYDIPIVSDSAESVGSKFNNKCSGVGSTIAIYSFNGNKIITTSGGGIVSSDNKEYIEKTRHLSQQARESASHYEHTQIGYNYRMSNISAAIGLGQLKYLEDRVARRREIFEKYRFEFMDFRGIEFMPEHANSRSNRWLTVILIDSNITGFDREKARLALERINIESRPVWKPMHLQPVFKDCLMIENGVCSDLFKRGLCLPSGSNMDESDICRVVNVIKNIKD